MSLDEIKFDELFAQLLKVNNEKTLNKYLMLIEQNHQAINYEKEDGLPQKKLLPRVFRLMRPESAQNKYVFYEKIIIKLILLGAKTNEKDGMNLNAFDHAKLVDNIHNQNLYEKLIALIEKEKMSEKMANNQLALSKKIKI